MAENILPASLRLMVSRNIYPIPTVGTIDNYSTFFIFWNTTGNGDIGYETIKLEDPAGKKTTGNGGESARRKLQLIAS